jgi:PAS domain-containing protein
MRVGYAGDIDQLRAAVDGLEPPVECVSLADVLKDFDLQPGTAPVDIVLIEYGDKANVAIADVRARNLEVALVLLVEPADERTALETFGAGFDDYIAKTSDWTSRVQLRLTAARTRYQQTRELASLRLKEARLRSLVEKLPACIVRLSADGVVLATNDRAVTLLGGLSRGLDGFRCSYLRRRNEIDRGRHHDARRHRSDGRSGCGAFAGGIRTFAVTSHGSARCDRAQASRSRRGAGH